MNQQGDATVPGLRPALNGKPFGSVCSPRCQRLCQLLNDASGWVAPAWLRLLTAIGPLLPIWVERWTDALGRAADDSRNVSRPAAAERGAGMMEAGALTILVRTEVAS